VVNCLRPFNAEPPDDVLIGHYITPNENFYVRNHGPVPQIDVQTYKLIVDGLVTKKLVLTLDDLKTKYKHVSVMATLQCAGNRRTEMHNLKPIKGVGWGISTISNAVWGGVLLRDVLLEAGVVCADTDNRHVAFEGLDWIADKRAGYGSSIQFDYKMFPPFVDWNNVEKWWHLSRPVLEMNVQSCICQPQEKEVITGKDGMYTIKGYAISGGGRRIERVDLSLDGGSTWVVVGLTRGEDKGYRNCYWSWTFWEKTVPIIDIGPTLVCRCWDSGSNTQPEGILPLWNLRGILNNAWHRINVIVNKSKL